MRILNGSLCAMLVLFAAVQVNDPDAPLWVMIYGIAAAWTGLAAWRPDIIIRRRELLIAFGLSMVAASAGSILMWPRQPLSWWENEEMREGMGLLIASGALLVVAWTLWRHAGVRRSEAGP